MTYDELLDFIAESTFSSYQSGDLIEEASDRKEVSKLHNSAKTAQSEYQTAKKNLKEAQKSGDRKKISEAEETVASTKKKFSQAVQSFRGAQAKAVETYQNTPLGKFGTNVDKMAGQVNATVNSAKEKIKEKQEFLTGAATGAVTGAATTAAVSGISKLLGVSLLSIAAIKAAGGIAKAGKGVMYMGKSQNILAKAKKKEIKAAAKLNKAKKNNIETDIQKSKYELDTAIADRKKAEKDVAKEKKEEKLKIARNAKLYKVEAEKLEAEAKRIEKEMQDTLAAYEEGRLKKHEFQKRIEILKKAAKNLSERARNVKDMVMDKVTKESVNYVEYMHEFSECFADYAAEDFLESVDLTDAAQFLIEEYCYR